MKILKIETSTFKVDGGAVFGVVPKRVWQKRYPCDDDNFCQVSMRCMLVDTGNKLILIDTGTGDKQLDYLKYYDFKGVINFETELNAIGYSCAQVTDVILTHLHFDHCGGCTYWNEDKSKALLTFPNATHHVGRAQWENFLQPNVREGDSYFKENMMPIVEAGKLNLIETNQYLCEEVEMRLFNGHTVGHIAVYVHSESKTIIYTGDVIPIVANIPLAWVSAYDTNPVLSMKEKDNLLTEAAEKNQVLFFEHDAYNECCTVKQVDGRFRMDKTFRLDEL